MVDKFFSAAAAAARALAEAGKGTVEAAKQTVQKAGDAIGNVAEKTAEATQKIGDTVRGATETTTEAAGTVTKNTVDTARKLSGDVPESAKSAVAETGKGDTASAYGKTESALQSHPRATIWRSETPTGSIQTETSPATKIPPTGDYASHTTRSDPQHATKLPQTGQDASQARIAGEQKPWPGTPDQEPETGRHNRPNATAEHTSSSAVETKKRSELERRLGQLRPPPDTPETTAASTIDQTGPDPVMPSSGNLASHGQTPNAEHLITPSQTERAAPALEVAETDVTKTIGKDVTAPAHGKIESTLQSRPRATIWRSETPSSPIQPESLLLETTPTEPASTPPAAAEYDDGATESAVRGGSESAETAEPGSSNPEPANPESGKPESENSARINDSVDMKGKYDPDGSDWDPYDAAAVDPRIRSAAQGFEPRTHDPRGYTGPTTGRYDGKMIRSGKEMLESGGVDKSYAEGIDHSRIPFKDGKTWPAMPMTLYTHVEPKVAADLRRLHNAKVAAAEPGTKVEPVKAEVVLDNGTCGTRSFEVNNSDSCWNLLAHVMPKDSEMSLWSTTDGGRTFYHAIVIGTGRYLRS